MGESLGKASPGIEAMDGIGDGIGHVDAVAGVRLETVRGHLAGSDADAAGDLSVGFRPVAQEVG